MQKIKDINEAISYLKQGDILTENGKNNFVFKNNRIYNYNEGTRYSLELEDFVKLFNKSTFYLYEESAEIDESKDEAYYRYYKK